MLVKVVRFKNQRILPVEFNRAMHLLDRRHDTLKRKRVEKLVFFGTAADSLFLKRCAALSGGVDFAPSQHDSNK